nr:reverse transcriptase domain-containing protein [Tanacetum cinerariifolium]
MGKKEAAAKDKPTTIYMVRSWQRTVKQKTTQSFKQGKEITFPPLVNSNEAEGPLVIEPETNGPSDHITNRFSGETTWPLGQLKLLVTIGDVTHSTKAWMNFMIVKSLSPYNDIIGRPRLKAIQAVPSTIYGMLKFPAEEGVVTIRSSLLVPAECASVDTSSVIPGEKKAHPANLMDCYPLPEIDWKVQSLCGYPFKCFLNAYKGYHQIQMAAADEEKTAFHTRQGVYYYTKIPFGLKNAGATYQRLMDKAFENQMGRNI